MRYQGGPSDISNFSNISIMLSPDHLSFGTESVMSVTLLDSQGQAKLSKIWAAGSNVRTGEFTQDFALLGFAGINLTDVQKYFKATWLRMRRSKVSS